MYGRVSLRPPRRRKKYKRGTKDFTTCSVSFLVRTADRLYVELRKEVKKYPHKKTFPVSKRHKKLAKRYWWVTGKEIRVKEELGLFLMKWCPQGYGWEYCEGRQCKYTKCYLYPSKRLRAKLKQKGLL